jgi:hypothetical protein
MVVLGGWGRYNLYSLIISSLDGCEWCHTLAALCPQGRDPWYPLEPGWAPELVWMQRQEEKFHMLEVRPSIRIRYNSTRTLNIMYELLQKRKYVKLSGR